MNGEQRRLDPRTFHPPPSERGAQGAGSVHEARMQARREGEHYAAMVAGAVEGFLEAIERYRLAEKAEQALEAAGDTGQELASGLRRQYQDPAYDDIKHQAGAKFDQAKDTVHEKADLWSDELSDQAHQAERTVERGYTRVKDTLDDAVDATRDAWERTKNVSRRTVDEGKARAQLVGVGLERAAHAPGAMLRDTKQATGAWLKGFWSSMGLYIVTGIVALTAFVLLTMATVVGLNNAIGRPEGTFVAFAIYAVAAVAVLIGARSAMQKGRQRAAKHMEDAKQEADRALAPFERAFATHWITGEPAVVRPPSPPPSTPPGDPYTRTAEPTLATRTESGFGGAGPNAGSTAPAMGGKTSYRERKEM